ncbi:MAG: EF-hand domain-containing protein [Akkermansiaceae bacterium]|jgi:Ca2+-binding EF-hand superfamily protein|nr:EF-hand domain-containing protein [Akkermansiaceae bacterium]
MKATSTLIAGALLLGTAALNAQDSGPRKPFGTGELPEFLQPYDLDGDGKLSVEERQAYEQAIREAMLNRPNRKHPWDTDGDGVISDEERQAAREAIAAKIIEARTKRFNELDADDDGYLTKEELLAIPRITEEMALRMIRHLDKDLDGKISLSEFLTPLRPVPPPIPPFPLPQPLPEPRDPGIFVPRLLVKFDANQDGRLSKAEIAAMKTALDTNADGRISFEEWKAYLDANPDVLPPPPPR